MSINTYPEKVIIPDLESARIQIPGNRSFFFFGFNGAVGNSGFEDIHPAGGDINWLQTAGQIEITSSDDEDGGAVQIQAFSVLKFTGWMRVVMTRVK